MLMCLAVPGKIISLDGDIGKVDFGSGVIREVNLAMLEVSVGEYVIVHAGFAIQKLDEREAQETLKTMREFLDTANKAASEHSKEE